MKLSQNGFPISCSTNLITKTETETEITMIELIFDVEN